LTASRWPVRTQRQLSADQDGRSTFEEFCQAKAREAHNRGGGRGDRHQGPHHEYAEAECEGPDSKEDDGALMKYVLGVHGMNIQRYWNGALVGPDCRTLLEKHGEILGAIRQGTSGGEATRT